MSIEAVTGLLACRSGAGGGTHSGRGWAVMVVNKAGAPTASRALLSALVYFPCIAAAAAFSQTQTAKLKSGASCGDQLRVPKQ